MQRLTVPVVDQFIADLKDCIREEKIEPKKAKGEEGNMVALYGMFSVQAFLRGNLLSDLCLSLQSVDIRLDFELVMLSFRHPCSSYPSGLVGVA